MFLDSRSKSFVADVLEVVNRHVPVLEAFVIGSGAVGGFDPRTSDIDLVVVIQRALGTERAAVVEELAALETPACGLELVVYVEGSQPPAFELNLNEGVERPNEEAFWFVLDAALAQERAVPVWGSRHWDELFAPISPERAHAAMTESLEWAERQPPDDGFARRHAARARHYLARGEWITKSQALGIRYGPVKGGARLSEGEEASRTETFLYDADGNRTEDESVAVRGEIVELDAAGRVLSRRPHDGLDWQVDPKSIEGDEGELATRPRHDES